MKWAHSLTGYVDLVLFRYQTPPSANGDDSEEETEREREGGRKDVQKKEQERGEERTELPACH